MILEKMFTLHSVIYFLPHENSVICRKLRQKQACKCIFLYVACLPGFLALNNRILTNKVWPAQFWFLCKILILYLFYSHNYLRGSKRTINPLPRKIHIWIWNFAKIFSLDPKSPTSVSTGLQVRALDESTSQSNLIPSPPHPPVTTLEITMEI